MTVSGSALAWACISGTKGAASWIAKARLQTYLETQYIYKYYKQINPKKLCAASC